MSSLQVEARAFAEEDLAPLAGALERAGRSRSLDELRWRYLAPPHGACIALARDAAGELRAGIAATRHRALLEGQPVTWLEVGDLFNDFAAGRGLIRARALLGAGRAFAEAFGGFAPEKSPVVYGLPDRRAHRIGLKHLEWEVLRSENELRVELARLETRSAPAVEVEEVQRFPDAIDACGRRFSEGRVALIARERAYLDWRYAGSTRHRIGLARRGAELVGYAVYRAGWTLDWCVRPEDDDVAGELLAWLASCAGAEGRSALALVVPDSAPEWLAFQRRGFRVHGTREYLCFRSFQRPAIMSWLFKNWYYTRGDTLR